MLLYLIWKRRFRATCWYKNQNYGPTYRYFMIIFWCPPGVWKHATLFCLSLSNLLTYIRLPYIRWKGTSIALIWGILSCSIPRGCIDMKEGSDLQNLPSYRHMERLIVRHSKLRSVCRETIFTLVIKVANSGEFQSTAAQPTWVVCVWRRTWPLTQLWGRAHGFAGVGRACFVFDFRGRPWKAWT